MGKLVIVFPFLVLWLDSQLKDAKLNSADLGQDCPAPEDKITNPVELLYFL